MPRVHGGENIVFSSTFPLHKHQLKDLNIRPKTAKLLEHEEEKLFDSVLGNDFMTMTPKTQATKTKLMK